MQEGRREIKYWAHENDAGGVDPFEPARRWTWVDGAKTMSENIIALSL